MLVFVVPIKSSQVASNWEVFSILVERTMKSISQQTSQNFRIVAVCHEIPPINFEHPNLEFVQVDFLPPTEENIAATHSDTNEDALNYRNGAKEADKAKKIMKGVEYGKKYNPTHYMVVDADDCINKNLVKFVEDNPSENAGWYFKKGYIYNEGSNLIFLNKNTFNVLCGTCIIIKADQMDNLLEYEPIELFNHDYVDFPNGNKLEPLPFPGAIYSIGNTENYCSTPEAVKKMNSYSIFKKGFFENIVRKAAKYRVKFVNEKFRSKFGLTKLDFTSVFETN